MNRAEQNLLYDTNTTTFLGMPMRQYGIDLLLWEHFFTLYKEDIVQVIELGSGYGGFSLYLLLQCIQHNLEFYTFDNKFMKAHTSKVGKKFQLKKHFAILDIFKQTDFVHIKQLMTHPTLLICDNGDKPKEIATFAPLLEPGDFLTVHDWGVEIFAKDIPSQFKPVIATTAQSVESLTGFFYYPRI